MTDLEKIEELTAKGSRFFYTAETFSEETGIPYSSIAKFFKKNVLPAAKAGKHWLTTREILQDGIRQQISKGERLSRRLRG